jgi:hypothetical protein
LPVAGTPAPEQLPEQQLNELLRRADWRFLLRGAETPWIADLTSGRDSQAITLIAAKGEPPAGEADVAATGFPSKLALRAALDAVHPGGEVVCLWRLPRPFGARRAAARLRKAGLLDVRVFWPGPVPQRPSQFWLSLDSPAASAHLLAARPAHSALQRALRPLWRLSARAGLLAPLCAIGRVPGGEDERASDELEAAFPANGGQLLLTSGKRSINKAVGLPFADDAGAPATVVKFARVAAADEALAREAATLRLVERDRPGATRVPRLLAEGKRAGRHALAESAVHGEPLIAALSPGDFEQLAAAVGEWLVNLSGGGIDRSRERWWPRLVGAPLERFEQDFGEVIAAGSLERLRERLAALGELPEACEHRDCSPWNVVLDEGGNPGLHDWESAEPHGLPGLDLAYFLANCAFVLDDALESGRTRESYQRLLDPATPYGAIAAARAGHYCEQVGIAAADYARLRLLCWVVHSRSDHQHLTMAAAGPPSREALRSSSFLGLLGVELERPEPSG